MKTFISKFLALFFAFIVFVSSSIYFFKIDSFAVEVIGMDETFIEQWLFPIFSINNEWTFSQAGARLRDSIEQHAATDNLSYSSDYNNAYAKTFGINDLTDPFDLTDADEFYTCFFANDVNYKKYVLQHKVEDIKDYITSEEAQNLKNYLISPDVVHDLGYETIDQAWLNSTINTINLGGQTIVCAFDKTGAWLGSSFNNIISSVKELTDTNKSDLKYQLLDEYNYSSVLSGTSYLSSFVYDKFESSTVDDVLFNFQIKLNTSNVFYYSVLQSSGNYKLWVCYPYRVNGVTLSPPTVLDLRRKRYDNGRVDICSNPVIKASGVTGIETFTINNTTWKTGTISGYYPTGTSEGNYLGTFATSGQYNTLAEIKSYIAANVFVNADDVDIRIPPYTVDIVDTDNVPYVVPDIDGLYGAITDIYPVIDALKDDILTVPDDLSDTKSLIDTVPSDIADAIAKAIADAIAHAITIPDILIDEATNPDNPDDPDKPDNPDDPFPDVPPNIPNWLWPTMFPDLFDIKGLDIFKPIFDIVGTNYSMYDTWVLIPTILIFVLIIYLIVSLL